MKYATFIRGWFRRYPELCLGVSEKGCAEELEHMPLVAVLEYLGIDEAEFNELVELGETE